MKLPTKIATYLLSGEFCLLRRLCTGVSPVPAPTPKTTNRINKWELYKKVSGVGYTGQKVTDVLTQLTDGGVQFNQTDLLFCYKKLQLVRRFHHCLEILQWMEKGEVDSSHYPLRLTLLYRLRGIDEAEKYFNSLPLHERKPYIYGALLNCYCSEKMTDKALAVFEKMDEMNACNELAFNNLMGLYVKVDQPEKVSPLIQEMKQRNIPLSSTSYLIWIQSFGRLHNLEGAELVMAEVKGQSFMKQDWKIHSVLASEYIKAGQSERARTALEKMEEIFGNSNKLDRNAYHYLISLYGNIGDLESVYGAWDKLKSKYKSCHNQSYRVMLQALSKLDSVEGVQKCFKEWESRYKSYDVRLTNVVVSTYLKHDMVEEAELLLKQAVDRSGQFLYSTHTIFMDYYLRKRQVDSSFRHMEGALANKWKPNAEKLDPFFEYFRDEKDVSGAEKLCDMLKKAQHINTRAYLWLVQIYAASGKSAPELRKRMEDDHITIGQQHHDLLNKVCPN